MLTKPQPPLIHLPMGWQDCVMSAGRHAITLAHYAIVYARARAADTSMPGCDSQQRTTGFRKSARCCAKNPASRTPAPRRSRRSDAHITPYTSARRSSILELRAARGWTLKQTADTFLVTPATIASWVKRIDENGPDVLLQLREPVNQFPDFVRYIVQRLKILSPAMGKVKIEP